MGKRPHIAAIVLVLLATSCSQPVTSPTSIPTDTPSTAPTMTMSMLAPTLTSVPTATSVPTKMPTERATAAPTATPEFTDWDSETWASVSPDGEWIAQAMAALPIVHGTYVSENYYTQLKVTSIDKTVEWTVVDEWSPWGLGYTTPQPFHWSKDGQYLYFTNRPVPDGCPGFVNGSDLGRVDLSDGSVTEIVPAVGLWLALSPDESRLAYVGYGGRGLIVRDLTTGEEHEIGLDRGAEGADLGHIVWAPDGTELMLTARFNSCGPPEERIHSIIRVDPSSGPYTTPVDSDRRLFVTEAWHAPGHVLLTDKDERHWELDVRTGDVTRVERAGCPSMSVSLEERVSRADWVLSGHVNEITFLDQKGLESWMGLHNYEPRIIVKLTVIELWKGESGAEEIVLHTRYNAWSFNNAARISSCSGFPFEEGEEYLVFAYRHNQYSRPLDTPNPFEELGEDSLDTSIWAGTKSLENATEDIRLLRERGAVVPDDEFAIYLVTQAITAHEMLQADLDALEIEDNPIISLKDIVAYAPTTHEMQLTESAYERIGQLDVPIQGLPFAVCVGHERIYGGAFWASYSSLIYEGVVINTSPAAVNDPGKVLRIELGYPPSSELFVGKDLRSDPRIIEVLEAENKLR